MITSLGVACDEALLNTDYDSPEALSSILSPCMSGLSWIDCRTDAATQEKAQGTFTVCPTDPADQQAWAQRFANAFSEFQGLNGQLDQYLGLVSSGPAVIASSIATGQTAATQSLTQALTNAHAPLDFTVAYYLASVGVGSYAGTSLRDYVMNYTKVPDYGIQGSALLYAAQSLYLASLLSSSDLVNLLTELSGDNEIDLGTKLQVEQVEYGAGIIN